MSQSNQQCEDAVSDWCIAIVTLNEDGSAHIREHKQLSEDESSRLREANDTLKLFIGRVTFSVLRQNYLSFVSLEKQLTAEISSSQPSGSIHPEATQVMLTTVTLNYLSSMRMFLDHAEKELTRRDKVDNGSRLDVWKEACSSEYDHYFAYRFLYRYRSYIQHRGLPLTMSEISGYRDDDGNVVGRLVLSESPQRLVENYDGWSKVEDELVSLTTEIDLSEQIHLSMECLDRIEECYIERFVPELTHSVDTITEVLGDVDDYDGTPIMAKFTRDGDAVAIQSMDIQIERFRVAQQVIVGHPY